MFSTIWKKFFSICKSEDKIKTEDKNICKNENTYAIYRETNPDIAKNWEMYFVWKCLLLDFEVKIKKKDLTEYLKVQGISLEEYENKVIRFCFIHIPINSPVRFIESHVNWGLIRETFYPDTIKKV